MKFTKLIIIKATLKNVIHEFPSCPFLVFSDTTEIDLEGGWGIREQIEKETGRAPFSRRKFPIPEMYDHLDESEKAKYADFAEYSEFCRSQFLDGARAIVMEIENFFDEYIVFVHTADYCSYADFIKVWNGAVDDGKFPCFVGLQIFSNWEDLENSIPDDYDFKDGERIVEVDTIHDCRSCGEVRYLVSTSDYDYYVDRLEQYRDEVV